MAVDCKLYNLNKLQMYGFGVIRQGLYAFNLPETKKKAYQATRVFPVLKGEATKEKVDKELKNLVRES
jgi:hypothetical protein